MESQVFAFNVQNIFGCISLPEANCLRNSFHIQHSWYGKKKKKKMKRLLRTKKPYVANYLRMKELVVAVSI